MTQRNPVTDPREGDTAPYDRTSRYRVHSVRSDGVDVYLEDSSGARVVNQLIKLTFAQWRNAKGGEATTKPAKRQRVAKEGKKK